MLEKLKEKRKEKRKEKILKKYIKTEFETELYVMKADDYVKEGKAKNFRKACELIKAQEEERDRKPKNHDLSETEKMLIKDLYGRDE